MTLARSVALALLFFLSGCALQPVSLEGRVCRTYLDCLVGQGYYCQPIDGGDGTDAGSIGVCMSLDGSLLTMDGGHDAGSDAGRFDAARDADVDAGVGDANVDAPASDAGVDGDVDSSSDAAVDGSSDAGSDASFDAAVDAPADDSGNDAAG